MTEKLTVLLGAEVLAVAGELGEAYGDAFGGEPWHRTAADVRAFRDRLETDARRPGFRAVLAESPDGLDGFASGWRTGAPFRADRAYGRVAEQLGADRVNELLVGAFEVDELAVRPHARRRSLGRRLLTAVVEEAPDGRAWLLTARSAADTVAFYRRVGWQEVPAVPGTEDNVIVFVPPRS